MERSSRSDSERKLAVCRLSLAKDSEEGRALEPRLCTLQRGVLITLWILGALFGGGTNAATLTDILKRNELVMCAQADALPFSRQGGVPEGFQVEIGRALAAELGVPLRVHFMRLHREPRRRECDALISVAIPKEHNPADYRTSDPYMVYRPVLVVRRSHPEVKSLGDFAPGRVAVQSGSWAHFLLTQQDIPVWVRFRTDEEIVRAVETGEAEAGIVSNFSYGWYLNGHPEALVREVTELALNDDLSFDVAVGLMDTDQPLLDRVNAGLARMSEGDIIATALKRYGIELESPKGTSLGKHR